MSDADVLNMGDPSGEPEEDEIEDFELSLTWGLPWGTGVEHASSWPVRVGVASISSASCFLYKAGVFLPR
jgi:hypothetical protein